MSEIHVPLSQQNGDVMGGVLGKTSTLVWLVAFRPPNRLRWMQKAVIGKPRSIVPPHKYINDMV